jgi:hypothetical protein
MPSFVRPPCREKQSFAAGLDRHEGKTVELSKMIRGQCFVRRTHSAPTIAEQQQEPAAIARRE